MFLAKFGVNGIISWLNVLNTNTFGEVHWSSVSKNGNIALAYGMYGLIEGSVCLRTQMEHCNLN